MVKNEMDIIESFVRYNANIFDGMLILDNGSTDDTLKILKLLKNDGFPLIIFEDEDREFKQAHKMNMLLKKAVKEFKADIIVPLDADEFLISSNGGNPRIILEQIEPNTFYSVKWKTYIPKFKKNEQKTFIPSKMTFIRSNAEEMNKIILTKELIENYSVKLSKGNHKLLYKKKYKKAIRKIFRSDLQIAHFPIRSLKQCMSKISVGWINTVCDINRANYESWHRKKMFDDLKKKGKLENEDIITLAKIYSTKTELKEIKIKKDPMDLTFCKNIELKYTSDKINPLKDILENCEGVSLDYLNLKKELLAKEKRYKNKINKLEQKLIEMKYLNNEGRSLIQKLISTFPSLYIILKGNNTGIKNILINIKGYYAIKKNRLFDTGFYLKRYPDVRKSGMDPLIHYMFYGFKEGKNPNSSFNGYYYINKYKDVKNSKLNPLIHYSLYGMREGRKTKK